MLDEETLAIQQKMSEVLMPDRFRHTIGVANTAACLAMRYGSNVLDAYLAGLLHDCGKDVKYNASNYIEYAVKYGLELSEVEKENVQLIHAKLGGYLSKAEYNISNPDIINAVTYHTTGRPGMSLLEKIIYIADYIEPGRYKQKNLDYVRNIAFSDIDRCMYKILSDTIEHLNEKKYVIDEATIITYNYFKKLLGEND